MKAPILLIVTLYTFFSSASSLAQQGSDKAATQLTLYSTPSMKNVAPIDQALHAVNAVKTLAIQLQSAPSVASPTSMAIFTPRMVCTLPGGYTIKFHKIIYPNDQVTECSAYEHIASGAFVKMYVSYNAQQPTDFSIQYAYAKGIPESTRDNLVAQLKATLHLFK